MHIMDNVKRAEMKQLSNHSTRRENFDASIIMVSWNAKSFLMQCLQSVYETTQDMKCEIFVVDNGSFDGSPDAVARQFPQVKLIRNKSNLGFSCANNIGITKSTARYIYLINSDILVLPGCISNLFTFMTNHSNVGMAAPQLLDENRTIQRSCTKFPNFSNTLLRAFAVDRLYSGLTSYMKTHNTRELQNGAMRVDSLSGAFWVVRREALSEVGLLDEDFFMYGEDIDWCKRFHKSGWDVVYYRNAEAIHFGGMSSSNEPIRFYIEIYKSRLKYWKKHHGGLGKTYYVAVMVLHQLLRIIPNLLLYLILKSKRKSIVCKIERSVACLRWLVSV